MTITKRTTERRVLASMPTSNGTHRKIAVVTTSRADFSHLYWPLKRLREHDNVDVRVLALGAHLSPEFGHTAGEISAAGFEIDTRIECLLSSDTDVGMAKTIGVATLGLADALGSERPDLLLLIADRYEMLAPAAVALALRIPMAHIEGGEVSEGAIDDAVRNALTKMSHLHLTPTAAARRRVLAMGEEPWRVHRVGAPSLDHLVADDLPDRASLERRLEIELAADLCVVAYHPVTLLTDTTDEADAVFDALDSLEGQLVLCFPNADAGSRAILERARAFVKAHAGAHLFVNLDPREYWALLRHAQLLLGNSSSGIMESPSLGLPTVNIGLRQEGRERAANIIDCPASTDSILAAVESARSPSFRQVAAAVENPYGDGRAGERIAEILANVELGDRLLRKRAIPVNAPDGAASAAFLLPPTVS